MGSGSSFRLLRLAGLVWLGIFYFLASGLYPAADWLQGAVWRMGYPAVVCVLALGWAGWGWRRKGGRVDWLAGTALVWGLAGSLLLLPLILGREGQLMAEQAQREAVAELREAVELERSRRLAEERMAVRKAAAERPPDRFRQYEGRLPAEELAQVRELDKELQGALQETAEAYRQALAANPTRGPMEWIRFETVDELETELARHRQLYEKTRTFTEAMEGFEKRYMAGIEGLSVGTATRRVAVAELERVLQYWRREGAYDLRKLDVQLLASAQQALRALRESWGEWDWNARLGKPVFESEEGRARFLQAVERMESLQEEVRRIREAAEEE